MADKTVDQLTTLTTADGADQLPIRDADASELKKITIANLLTTLTSLLGTDAIDWTAVDKTGSSIADLATKTATLLTSTGPDKMLGRFSSGTGVLEEVPCTTFARSLLDDATAAAARTTLDVPSNDDLDATVSGWYEVPATSYDGTGPLFEVYNGVDISAVDDWAPSTSYSLGDFVKPTTTGNFIFECVDAGTSHTSEPTWSETADVDCTDNDITWRARGLHVIEMSENLTLTLGAGTPVYLEFSDEAILRYGIVADITATRMVIKSNYFWPDKAFTLYRGAKTKVTNLLFTAAGEYATGSNVIGPYKWFGPQKVLVDFRFAHVTDGSGAQPIFNIEINESPVLRAGAQASITYNTFLYDDLNLAYLNWWDDLEIIPESSASTASNLTVILVLVTV